MRFSSHLRPRMTVLHLVQTMVESQAVLLVSAILRPSGQA